MPRVATPNKHRIQRAFAPLVFRTHFQPERLLTRRLPWNISYPPHGDGKPADDVPLAAREGASANTTALTKIKRPPGEPGRKGGRGFSTKDMLNLSEEIYEELLVSLRYRYILFHQISPTS